MDLTTPQVCQHCVWTPHMVGPGEPVNERCLAPKPPRTPAPPPRPLTAAELIDDTITRYLDNIAEHFDFWGPNPQALAASIARLKAFGARLHASAEAFDGVLRRREGADVPEARVQTFRTCIRRVAREHTYALCATVVGYVRDVHAVLHVAVGDYYYDIAPLVPGLERVDAKYTTDLQATHEIYARRMGQRAARFTARAKSTKPRRTKPAQTQPPPDLGRRIGERVAPAAARSAHSLPAKPYDRPPPKPRTGTLDLATRMQHKVSAPRPKPGAGLSSRIAGAVV
ncbi:hypothetical protein Q8F55_008536 [Vanrija albida]|uniref:Uncharacterized protein n=1 Tax=Vanrija albida TaxID=181172 RepID=A0ABR3PR44_9TREE